MAPAVPAEPFDCGAGAQALGGALTTFSNHPENGDKNGPLDILFNVGEPIINHSFGNGNRTTYKNGDLGEGLWHCFTHMSGFLENWFKGQFTGKPQISWETMVSGFRLRFSLKSIH